MPVELFPQGSRDDDLARLVPSDGFKPKVPAEVTTVNGEAVGEAVIVSTSEVDSAR